MTSFVLQRPPQGAQLPANLAQGLKAGTQKTYIESKRISFVSRTALIDEGQSLSLRTCFGQDQTCKTGPATSITAHHSLLG